LSHPLQPSAGCCELVRLYRKMYLLATPFPADEASLLQQPQVFDDGLAADIQMFSHS
jgi:hypothetical protein